MMGGALPREWEIMDAELYAIFRVLRAVWYESRLTISAANCRVLIMSDCLSAITQVECAWREGHAPQGRRGDRRAMVEAICSIRAELGQCVICYMPAHVGCSPNEYADACAKCHLTEEHMEDVTGRLNG